EAIRSIDVSEPVAARIEPGELAEPDRRLQVGQLEIESDAGMDVVAARAPHRSPLILQLAQADGKGIVVGNDQTSLARGDRLVRREREASGAAEGPEILSVMPGSERLGGVLDHRNAVRIRAVQDALDRGSASADVHRYHRSRPRRDSAGQGVG